MVEGLVPFFSSPASLAEGSDSAVWALSLSEISYPQKDTISFQIDDQIQI